VHVRERATIQLGCFDILYVEKTRSKPGPREESPL